MSSLRSNPRLLCIYHALQMSLFPMAILTVFYHQELGMDMKQIMLLQGAFGLVMALFEFPSGYLADRIGYRRTLIIASVLNALGWSAYVRAESILEILFAEAILGIGISLVSGTDMALLYESLEETDEETQFGHWAGRVKFWGQLGEGTAAIVAGFLYVHWNRLPFILEVGIWVVNIFVAWRLVEPARHRPPIHDNWKQVKAMVHHVAVQDVRLRAIVLLTIALGMSSFMPVWTIQLYGIEAGLPASWLGVIWAVANYSVAVGSLYSTRVSGVLGVRRLVILCIALIALGYFGMGLTHAIWGIAFYFSLTIMRGLFGPSIHHLEQRRIPSSDRAGFVSLRSLLFRSSFLILAPLVGIGMDAQGQHPVLLVLGVLLSLAAALGLWNLERSGALEST
ncbi:MAG: MFS family permease [Candidatus Paceibacteria bacterium]|jgi:MFS family permease